MILFSGFSKNKSGIRRYIGPKRVIFATIFVTCSILAWNSYHAGSLKPELVERYLNDNPVHAVLLFIAIFSISLCVCLPTLPLNIAAGFFWGGLLGGFYTVLGATIGSWAAFLAARYLFGQPLARRFDNQWMQMVQREFDASGWKFVAFARINPIIPTGPLNYLLGLTSLSSRGFVLSTFISLLPPATLVSYLGDAARSLVTQPDSSVTLPKHILLISFIVTVLAAGKIAARIYGNIKAGPQGRP